MKRVATACAVQSAEPKLDVKRLATTSSVVSASLPGVNPPASPTSAFGVTGSASTCVNASWTASRAARSTPIAWTFSRSPSASSRSEGRSSATTARPPARNSSTTACPSAPAAPVTITASMPDILHAVGVTRARVGTSGWRYPPWRRTFYPDGLAQRRELEHLSRRVDTIEINGSFYSLQRPESWQAWARETPDDFVFAVKGPRFVTHMKQLRDVATPVANFLASGVLALGPKLGPVLWQLPPRMRFDAARVAAFLELLPRTTAAAARLAEQHDERLDGRALTATDADRPLRHAVEPRHESFRDPAFAALLREHGIALVMADSAGHLAGVRRGHGRLPLRPPARRRRAVRLGLHRRGPGCMGRSACGRGWPTATSSSTSTTTPRSTPRTTRSRWPSG